MGELGVSLIKCTCQRLQLSSVFSAFTGDSAWQPAWCDLVPESPAAGGPSTGADTLQGPRRLQPLRVCGSEDHRLTFLHLMKAHTRLCTHKSHCLQLAPQYLSGRTISASPPSTLATPSCLSLLPPSPHVTIIHAPSPCPGPGRVLLRCLLPAVSSILCRSAQQLQGWPPQRMRTPALPAQCWVGRTHSGGPSVRCVWEMPSGPWTAKAGAGGAGKGPHGCHSQHASCWRGYQWGWGGAYPGPHLENRVPAPCPPGGPAWPRLLPPGPLHPPHPLLQAHPPPFFVTEAGRMLATGSLLLLPSLARTIFPQTV